MHFHFVVSSLAALVAQVTSLPNSGADKLGTAHITFRSQILNDTSLRYVINSGVCETTPGVNQYSGYVEVGVNMSMWFWFFEARNSPENAPITLWLQGGPGCSSMYGLFQENGPCRVNPDGKTTQLNPYSWNNVSNMFYLDQPIGAGFSYGTEAVNSSEDAAPFVWKAFQILFESKVFLKYASREFIIAAESYGGRYVPAFATHFHEQNIKITRGEIEGECIIITAIMIDSGWIDPLIQDKSLYNFTANAPGYGQLQPDDLLKNLSDALYGPDGCVAQESNCYAAGNSPKSNDICVDADAYCADNVIFAAIGDRSPYNLSRTWNSSSFPPEYYVDYLGDPEVLKKIGAETKYVECSYPVRKQVQVFGDAARTSVPQLSRLVATGLRVLIWYGDLDIIANWLGGYDTVLAMDWYGKETLRNTPLGNITLHGTTIAAVANVDHFSFAVLYAAGHMLPTYQPAATLEIFRQVVNQEPIHSV